MFPPDLVHVLGRALVAYLAEGDVELEVKAGAREVVIVGSSLGMSYSNATVVS